MLLTNSKVQSYTENIFIIIFSQWFRTGCSLPQTSWWRHYSEYSAFWMIIQTNRYVFSLFFVANSAKLPHLVEQHPTIEKQYRLQRNKVKATQLQLGLASLFWKETGAILYVDDVENHSCLFRWIKIINHGRVFIFLFQD